MKEKFHSEMAEPWCMKSGNYTELHAHMYNYGLFYLFQVCQLSPQLTFKTLLLRIGALQSRMEEQGVLF